MTAKQFMNHPDAQAMVIVFDPSIHKTSWRICPYDDKNNMVVAMQKMFPEDLILVKFNYQARILARPLKNNVEIKDKSSLYGMLG